MVTKGLSPSRANANGANEVVVITVRAKTAEHKVDVFFILSLLCELARAGGEQFAALIPDCENGGRNGSRKSKIFFRIVRLGPPPRKGDRIRQPSRCSAGEG